MNQFSSLYGEGRYQAAIVIIPMPRQQVAAMLPETLSLAPGPEAVAEPAGLSPPLEQAGVMAGEWHPLIFMFGRQNQVAPRPWKLFEWNYLEFGLAVPYVYPLSVTGAGPCLFFPRLYLNRTRPIIAGYFYGLAKVRASIGQTENRYLVNDLNRRTLIVSGKFEKKGELGPPSALPLFERAIPALLQQPLVGQTLAGRLLYSRFEWGFEQATVQPIAAGVQIARAFLPGLSPGQYLRPGLDEDPLGSFRLVTHWRLSPPCLTPYLRPEPTALATQEDVPLPGQPPPETV